VRSERDGLLGIIENANPGACDHQIFSEAEVFDQVSNPIDFQIHFIFCHEDMEAVAWRAKTPY